MEGIHDSVGSWESRNSEICMGLCLCIHKCEKLKGERGHEEVLELCEQVFGEDWTQIILSLLT